MNGRSAVHNAADPEQVEKAQKSAKARRERELEDLKVVLNMPGKEGRRVLNRLFAECKTFQSIFVASSEIYKNAGRQDIGHWLMAEVEAASPEALMEIILKRKES